MKPHCIYFLFFIFIFEKSLFSHPRNYLKEPLTAEKREIFPSISKCDDEMIVCNAKNVSKVWMKVFEVKKGEKIRFWTKNLKCLKSSKNCYPDTLLYILYKNNSTIVAIDDDGNTLTKYPFDSYIEYIPEFSGEYWFIATGENSIFESTVDIFIEFNEKDLKKFLRQSFGGYHILKIPIYKNGVIINNPEVQKGDAFLVGKNKGCGFYHDTVLFYFTTHRRECNNGFCGKFLYNNDTSQTLLSRIDIEKGFESSAGRIIIGSNDKPPFMVCPSFFHIRRHIKNGGAWKGKFQIDNDGDGLPFEIENKIGTCDKDSDFSLSIGVNGFSCKEIKDFINERIRIDSKNKKACREINWRCDEVVKKNPEPLCWHPCDSDNDGIRDDIEIWAVETRCRKKPSSPFYDPGECKQKPLFKKLAGYQYVFPLSALEPSPSTYDIFLEIDYFTLEREKESMALSESQKDIIKNIFEIYPYRCWDGSLPPCELKEDRGYKIKIHIYQGKENAISAPYLSKFRWYAGANGTNSYFNKRFNPLKKFTKIFRYALTSYYTGGQALIGGRSLIFGNEKSLDINAVILSHELGHLLSLEHYPQKLNLPGISLPQYPSLMQHFYLNPLKDSFPSECSPKYARFSKGLNNLFYKSIKGCEPPYGYAVDEAKPNEYYEKKSPLSRKFVYEVFCTAGKFKPSCSDDYCCIDWNLNDGKQCNKKPPSFNIDNVDSLNTKKNSSCPSYGNDKNLENDRLPDNNDIQQIFAYAKNGLEKLNNNFFQIYADGFNNSNVYNFAAWDFPVEFSADFEDGLWIVNHCKNENDCKNKNRCVNGICSCKNDGDCFENKKCINSLCESFSKRYGKAIKFRGSGFNDRLILKNSGEGNPINSIKSFSFIFDIFWYGVKGNEKKQTIISSNFLNLWISEKGEIFISLFNEKKELKYEKYIERNQWYRFFVEYDHKKSDFYFLIMKQNPSGHGIFSHNEFLIDGCMNKKYSISEKDFSASEIRIGVNFNGLIDNLNIYNGVFERRKC